jgi:hypothetical protein
VCFLLTSPFIERGYLAPQPSTWRGRSEQISLDQGGCEARKIPAEGRVFSLDFSLYRTSQERIYFHLKPRFKPPTRLNANRQSRAA